MCGIFWHRHRVERNLGPVLIQAGQRLSTEAMIPWGLPPFRRDRTSTCARTWGKVEGGRTATPSPTWPGLGHDPAEVGLPRRAVPGEPQPHLESAGTWWRPQRQRGELRGALGPVQGRGMTVGPPTTASACTRWSRHVRRGLCMVDAIRRPTTTWKATTPFRHRPEGRGLPLRHQEGLRRRGGHRGRLHMRARTCRRVSWRSPAGSSGWKDGELVILGAAACKSLE